jgi:hypothetical protein
MTALGRVLAAGSRTLLIGTDAPALTAGRLGGRGGAVDLMGCSCRPSTAATRWSVLPGRCRVCSTGSTGHGTRDGAGQARLAAAAVASPNCRRSPTSASRLITAHPDTAGWLRQTSRRPLK